MKAHFKLYLAILLVALAALAMTILAFQPTRAAGPWYVAPGGDDGNDCLSPAAACATINGALAKPGFVISDTILVASGTYTGTGDEVVLLDKSATLSGGWDVTFTTQSGVSTIDGDGVRRGINVNNNVTAIINRFTIQNGYTDSGNGGGIYNSGTLTLTNCTINDNFAYYDGYDDHGGGGIYNIGALTLISGTVKNNTATDSGGGIYGTSGSSTVIVEALIYANKAFNNEGGGIQFDYDSHLSISRSWVVGNAALGNDAGGVGVSGGSAYIENSIIAGNTTEATGGGLWLMEGGPYRIVNSHIIGNEANFDGAAIVGNTVQVEVTNTLIISNTGNTGIGDQWGSGAVFLLSYCDTYGNSPDGTFSVTIVRTNCLGTPPEDGLDPLMSGGALPGGVGPAFAAQWMGYDYSLQVGSPAIDTGTPTGAPATDIEGTPRDASPDMGAYELPPPLAFSAKTVSQSTALPGDPLTYTIALNNGGATTITNVSVTDTLPISLTYVDSSLTATGGSYGYNTGVITWTGSVSAGSVVTIIFGATVSETTPLGVSITNSAVISGGGEILTRTATIDVVRSVYLPIVLKNQ